MQDYPASDFRVRIDPTYADGLLLMDSSIQWNDDFGGDWFINAMVGIGTMLGLSRANDLPGTTLMAFQSGLTFLTATTPNGTFPSTSGPRKQCHVGPLAHLQSADSRTDLPG